MALSRTARVILIYVAGLHAQLEAGGPLFEVSKSAVFIPPTENIVLNQNYFDILMVKTQIICSWYTYSVSLSNRSTYIINGSAEV